LRADVILAQNAETRDWLPRRHRGKATLFPNAVIGGDISVAARVPDRTDPPVAVFAGRFEPWKGLFLCLHALKRLPDWRFVVCGSGRDEVRMRHLAKRLGVDDRVEWHGWLTHEQVLRQFAEADVFLFPSLREEAGAVIAEARAVGLPIVCLERGGPPLLAGPEGICVNDSGDVQAVSKRLADAMVRALGRRRGADMDGEPEPLHLARRADALREVLSDEVRPSQRIAEPA
jgi:glycosyltransferase involved in cell wall biosynthesis